MRIHRIVPLIAVAIVLSGCARLLHGFAPDCHKPQEYQRAVQKPPLQVPVGLDTPEYHGGAGDSHRRAGAAASRAARSCMDVPPRYQAGAAQQGREQAPARI